MSLPHHIRFGLNAVLGIALVTAVGYWFVSDWNARNLDDIILGAGPEQNGILARKPGEFRETVRRQTMQSLLVDPEALDSDRVVKLTVKLPRTAFLRPGETPPPEHLEELFIEARAPAMFQERCADWQAVMANRCKMLNASIDTGGGPLSGKTVTIEATYAISPRQVDPVEGNPDTMSIETMPIRFDIAPNTTTAATRRAVIEQAYRIYLTACADLRARVGNCNLVNFEFHESPLSADSFNLSGGAIVAGLKPGGRS